MSMNISENTLGSVFGSATAKDSGIFIGPLQGVSRAKYKKRMLYPTYKNSTGTNQLVKNSLNESYIYDENLKPWTGKDIQELMEAHTQQTAFKGGKFVQPEPKCAAFPYCNQGAVDHPIKLIEPHKGGMCEGCQQYVQTIAEQVGKTFEWVAEGFVANTRKALNELTHDEKNSIISLLQAIQQDPEVMGKIKRDLENEYIDTAYADNSYTVEKFISYIDAKYPDLAEKYQGVINQLLQLAQEKRKPKKAGLRKIFSLAESLESLDNKQSKTIKEMKVKSSALTFQHKASVLESIMTSPLAECVTTTLQKEGFVPLNEELNGQTVAESIATLMEDEDIVAEMFDSLMEGHCPCDLGLREWLQENHGDIFEEDEESTEDEPTEEPEGEESTDEPVVAADHDEEPGDAPEMVDEPGEELETAPEIEIQAAEVPAPVDDNNDTQVAVEGESELATALEAIQSAQSAGDDAAKFGHLTLAQIAINKALSAAQVKMEAGAEGEEGDANVGISALAIAEAVNEVLGEMGLIKEDTDKEINDMADEAAAMETGADVNESIADDDEAVEAEDRQAKAYAQHASKHGEDGDEKEELDENKLPIFGKNVMADNKQGAKETEEQAKAAIDSQKTEDQKVDDLKNQKYKLNSGEKTIKNKMLGAGGQLDIDYTNEPSEAFKKRVLDQASGVAPEDHANVDHNSTAGQQLIDAAKERAPEREKQYTSKPDATTVEDEDDKYQVTTVVNEDIERMKKLMNFDITKKKQDKAHKSLNEDNILFKNISKKKFL